MRSAIYARVSTKDQSCDLQVRDLRTYCAARKFTVFREYIDEGESGVKNSRPKIKQDGYLLDSPSPYRLWFQFDLRSGVKDSIQWNGLDCQRLLHEAKEELTAAF